jgi:tetratricopeptide (TPR) repeat protein
LAAFRPNDEAAAAYDKAARLVRSPRDLADWLRAAAADCEAGKRYDQGLWALVRAVQLTPDDWTLYAARALLAHQAGRQARAHSDLDEVIRRGADDAGAVARLAEAAAGSGDWKRAAALFTTLARIPNVPTQARYLQALASLKAGDPAGYRAACAGVGKQVPPVGPQLSGGVAYGAARVFTLGPGAADDWTRPLAWIDHALARLLAFETASPHRKDGPRRGWHLFLSARGALLFRAGRLEEAVQALGEALTHHPQGGDFPNWLFLTLTEHRLGHGGAARKAAAKARAAQARSKPGTVWDRAEVELLAAELDAALPVPGK